MDRHSSAKMPRPAARAFQIGTDATCLQWQKRQKSRQQADDFGFQNA